MRGLLSRSLCSSQFNRAAKRLRLMPLAALLLQGCVGPGATQAGRFCAPAGEYGANLKVLQASYTPPQAAGESNYFIDMQAGEPIHSFAATHGLTNNHALLVVSHGMAIQTPAGARYAFYPATGKSYGGAPSGPCFSIL